MVPSLLFLVAVIKSLSKNPGKGGLTASQAKQARQSDAAAAEAKAKAAAAQREATLLKGSWDLVTRVINTVAVLINTYNPS